MTMLYHLTGMCSYVHAICIYIHACNIEGGVHNMTILYIEVDRPL